MILLGQYIKDRSKIVPFKVILNYFKVKDPEMAGARLQLALQYYLDHDNIK